MDRRDQVGGFCFLELKCFKMLLSAKGSFHFDLDIWFIIRFGFSFWLAPRGY